MNKVVIITGINGFIGRNLAAKLAPEYKIFGVDSTKKNITTPNTEIHNVDMFNDREFIKTILQNLPNQLKCVVNLAAYYDFTNEHSDKYSNAREGFLSLIDNISPSVPIISASSTSMLYIEQKKNLKILPYMEDKFILQHELQKRAADSTATRHIKSLLFGGVYSDKCELYMLYHIINRIKEKPLDVYFYPGNSLVGNGYAHIEDVTQYLTNLIDSSVGSGFEREVISHPQLVSYADIYNTVCQFYHGTRYPLIKIPKIVGKVGLFMKNSIVQDKFFNPWMIDYCDMVLNATELSNGISNKNRFLLSDLPAILEFSEIHPEEWHRINERRGMSRLHPNF